MKQFEYSLIPVSQRKPLIGLIVLQSDETIEPELQQWLPPSQVDMYVSRVPSGEQVNEQSLAAMANDMTKAAELFPRSSHFDVVAYCCTSGTSVIGAERVQELVCAGCATNQVTNPLTALIDFCKSNKFQKLAFLSPYVEAVSAHLRNRLESEGITTPIFGSFNEGEEAKVAWIDERSIREAAKALLREASVDALFLSCTNLKTIGFRQELETEIGLPVLSSNYVLAEHLKKLTKHKPA